MVLYSFFEIFNWLLLLKPVSLIIEEINTFVAKIKSQIGLHNSQSFSFRIMAILRNKGKLAAVSRKKPKIKKTVSHRTQLIREGVKSTSPSFLKKVKGGSLLNFPNNSARRPHAFWVLCLNLRSFLWTHKCGLVP